MATHSSILAWTIPQTEKPTVQSHGVTMSQTRLNEHVPTRMRARTHAHTHTHTHTHTSLQTVLIPYCLSHFSFQNSDYTWFRPFHLISIPFHPYSLLIHFPCVFQPGYFYKSILSSAVSNLLLWPSVQFMILVIICFYSQIPI